MKPCSALPEDHRHVRVQRRENRLDDRDQQLSFSHFQYQHLVLHGGTGNAVLDGLNNLADLPLNGRQLSQVRQALG